MNFTHEPLNSVLAIVCIAADLDILHVFNIVHTILVSSSSLVFNPKAGFGRNQSPVRRPVWHTAF